MSAQSITAGSAVKPIQLSSYNTLSPTYADSDWYSHIDPSIMAWSNRQKALVSHISALESDVLCLQEVEPSFFAELQTHLGRQGYVGLYAQKVGKPDGLAFFYRPEVVKVSKYEIFYIDRTPTMWRPAQIIELEYGGQRVGLVNTHLAWDEAGNLAKAELQKLVEQRLVPNANKMSSWIICGDFNVGPSSEAVKYLQGSGFQYAGQGSEQITCSIKHYADTIDYIFYSSDKVKATAKRVADIRLGSPLPSLTEPSDHLAITATLTIRA